MALIKCPECNKENVSDTALSCPCCGFNIREYFESEKQKQEEQEYANEIIDIKYIDVSRNNNPIEYVEMNQGLLYYFNNGIANGIINGIVDINLVSYKYDTYNNNYLNKKMGMGVEYIIYGEFIVPTFSMCDISIPATRNFEQEVKTTYYTHKFYFDGTYENICSMGVNTCKKGYYMRENNLIICAYESSETESYSIELHPIINNTFCQGGGVLILYSEYIRCQQLMRKFKDNCQQKYGIQVNIEDTIVYPRNHPDNRIQLKQNDNLPKCSYCNSTNVKKITSTAKVVNIAMFGLLGNKRKYQWHCNNCDSDF